MDLSLWCGSALRRVVSVRSIHKLFANLAINPLIASSVCKLLLLLLLRLRHFNGLLRLDCIVLGACTSTGTTTTPRRSWAILLLVHRGGCIAVVRVDVVGISYSSLAIYTKGSRSAVKQSKRSLSQSNRLWKEKKSRHALRLNCYLFELFEDCKKNEHYDLDGWTTVSCFSCCPTAPKTVAELAVGSAIAVIDLGRHPVKVMIILWKFKFERFWWKTKRGQS